MTNFELLQQERTTLLELLESFTFDEWDAPTLDEGWAVRDVVAHLITRLRGYLRLNISTGFRFQKAIDKGVAQYRDESPEILINLLKLAVAPRWFNYLLPYTTIVETWIHQQDIRVPHNKSRPQNEQTLRLILGIFKRNAKQFHLRATDINWETGNHTNLLIEGKAEDIAMALAGRPQTLKNLRGPGVKQLVQKKL